MPTANDGEHLSALITFKFSAKITHTPGALTPGDSTRTGVVAIGVREGILLGVQKKFALKITICPETNFLVYSELGLKPYVNLVYTVKFVYNGFACNVNSPMALHFVRSRWHLLHAFQFAYNVNSAITFFMQPPRGAVVGKFCSYLAC